MARKIHPEDLSEQDLKKLLKEKRLSTRKQRLDAFRKSGRLVEITPTPDQAPGSLLEEYIEREPTTGEQYPQSNLRKRFIDRFLLVIEIGAIVALVFVLLNSFNVLQNLNNQISTVLELPTLTPTPLIQSVVLPSGHSIVDGIPRFNESEIPDHLRAVVQSYYDNLVIPTPSPEQAIRIQIPSIGVDAQIVQGDGWEALKQGVGQHIGSSNPGQNGNMVLSAHNDIYGQIFRYLDQLETGDEIIIHTNLRSYRYVIDRNFQVVPPTFVQVMDSTVNPTVTLISCYPYLINDQRIVVTGALVEN